MLSEWQEELVWDLEADFQMLLTTKRNCVWAFFFFKIYFF